MITTKQDEFLYVEKYRPSTVAECILPEELQSQFMNIVAGGEIPNLLLTGTTGLGKTTVAKAMCEELGCEYLFINASENNGIDVLRTTIRDFASTISLNGGSKVVILDEADNMSASLQPALRGFIEEFSKSCRFILTCNHRNKIIEALHSRLMTVEFKYSKTDAKLAGRFFKRVMAILDAESVSYDKAALAKVIQKYFPDFRKTLTEIQRYATQNGSIDLGAVGNSGNAVIADLIVAIKEKDYKKCRAWLVENADVEPISIIRLLYDNLLPEVKEAPAMILILNECQKHLPWVADTELHLGAMMIELMGSCTFRDHV